LPGVDFDQSMADLHEAATLTLLVDA
jgi:hypothetical protein